MEKPHDNENSGTTLTNKGKYFCKCEFVCERISQWLKCRKASTVVVLVCRPTVGFKLLGERQYVEGLESCVRLAMRAVPPGSIYSVGISKALGAWRYASLARRSGSGQRLAVCVPRQAILLF